MIYYAIKVIVTAIIIVLVTEISKRSSLAGALLASLPLVSYLAFIWLYHETKNIQLIADLSTNIFWLVIPSLSLFLLFPWMLRQGHDFYIALLASTLVMVGIYILLLKIIYKS